MTVFSQLSALAVSLCHSRQDTCVDDAQDHTTMHGKFLKKYSIMPGKDTAPVPEKNLHGAVHFVC